MFVWISKKKLREIEEEYKILRSKLENVDKALEIVSEMFSDEEPTLEEQKQQEIEAKQQLEQMQQLVVVGVQQAIVSMLQNEETQKQLVQYITNLIVQAQTQISPDVVKQKAILEQLPRDKEGNVDVGALLASKLMEMFSGGRNGNSKQVFSNNSNSGW